MRWRDQADWVVPGRRTHEALIPDDLAQAVRLRTQARRGPGLVCSRESTVPYALRGMLFCAVCGRRMQGAARVGKRTTRILYRCELGRSRSVPAELTDHPRTVYLREDAVTPRLDEWIATLADPEDLARGQEVDPVAGAGYAALQRQLSEANGKVAALVTAVESGVAVEDLTAALRRRTAERDELKALLERAERPCAMSAAQISELVEELGGLSAVLGEATGAERAQVYASLGLRLDDYDPHLRRVKARDGRLESCRRMCPRGDLPTNPTHRFELLTGTLRSQPTIRRCECIAGRHPPCGVGTNGSISSHRPIPRRRLTSLATPPTQLGKTRHRQSHKLETRPTAHCRRRRGALPAH